MIDHDDVDDIALASMFTSSGIFVLILISVACILLLIANDNEKECKTKSCPIGMSVVLSENKCLCVQEAK